MNLNLPLINMKLGIGFINGVVVVGNEIIVLVVVLVCCDEFITKNTIAAIEIKTIIIIIIYIYKLFTIYKITK